MNNIIRHPAQTRDFINRTKCIIEQYRQIKITKPEINYCNTLFLNICFSLLSICKIEMTESYNPFISKFPEDIVSKENWGIAADDIEIIKDDLKTVPNIIKGIRDCLDHNKFETNYGDDAGCAPIKWIKFEDEANFKATFPFEDFKQFVNIIANFTLSKLR